MVLAVFMLFSIIPVFLPKKKNAFETLGGVW